MLSPNKVNLYRKRKKEKNRTEKLLQQSRTRTIDPTSRVRRSRKRERKWFETFQTERNQFERSPSQCHERNSICDEGLKPASNKWAWRCRTRWDLLKHVSLLEQRRGRNRVEMLKINGPLFWLSATQFLNRFLLCFVTLWKERKCSHKLGLANLTLQVLVGAEGNFPN